MKNTLVVIYPKYNIFDIFGYFGIVDFFPYVLFWEYYGLLTMFNNVLLGKIEWPVWYTIYHQLPVVKGINKPLYQSTKQWEKDINATYGGFP